jgi:hypothetical protein
MKAIAIDDVKVMNLGLGRSIYSPAQLEERKLPGEPGNPMPLPGRECRKGLQQMSWWTVGLRPY